MHPFAAPLLLEKAAQGEAGRAALGWSTEWAQWNSCMRPAARCCILHVQESAVDVKHGVGAKIGQSAPRGSSDQSAIKALGPPATIRSVWGRLSSVISRDNLPQTRGGVDNRRTGGVAFLHSARRVVCCRSWLVTEVAGGVGRRPSCMHTISSSRRGHAAQNRDTETDTADTAKHRAHTRSAQQTSSYKHPVCARASPPSIPRSAAPPESRLQTVHLGPPPHPTLTQPSPSPSLPTSPLQPSRSTRAATPSQARFHCRDQTKPTRGGQQDAGRAEL